MEDTEEEVLEMFVSGNHAGKVLEIGCEFLKLDLVIRFNVVPAPDELRKGLFFAFLPPSAPQDASWRRTLCPTTLR